MEIGFSAAESEQNQQISLISCITRFDQPCTKVKNIQCLKISKELYASFRNAMCLEYRQESQQVCRQMDALSFTVPLGFTEIAFQMVIVLLTGQKIPFGQENSR